MENMRLKCGIEYLQIIERLKRRPEIIELQLKDTDIEKPEIIIKTIEWLQRRNIKVYLHHPIYYKGEYLNIMSTNKERLFSKRLLFLG